MAKYSYEFKKEVVLAYLKGKGSMHDLAKYYGIPDRRQICKWVNAYQQLGDNGLLRSRKKSN